MRGISKTAKQVTFPSVLLVLKYLVCKYYPSQDMFGLHGCILTELLNKVKYEKVASQNKIQHGEIFFL